MDNKYNEEYFYLTFETKIKWIVLAMIGCTLFHGGWIGMIILSIYMCYGLCKKLKLQAKVELKKQNLLEQGKEIQKRKETLQKETEELLKECKGIRR